VELLEELIKTYTQKGGTVLDFCMGSGSTGIACKQNRRNFIGIELKSDYYNLAKTRIESFKIKSSLI
jgi:site-specific DNA-methyltransferase (adenine-specific)